MTVTNDKIVGKQIKEISPTKDYIIIATYNKDGSLIIPQPENILARGEKISILVKRGSFKKVAKKIER